MSFADMIKAGSYGSVNEEITAANFPFEGTGKVETEIRLIHFNKWMTTQHVLAELEKLGLRPATLVELLAFGAKYPEQREYPIVALGSRARYYDVLVPVLDEDGDGRDLRLYRCDNRWRGSDRFLCVRK